MADTTHILSVGRIANCPVIHLYVCSLLGFLYRGHQHVDRAFSWICRRSVENWNTQSDSEPLPAGRLVLIQHSMLSVQLGLAVEISRAGCRIRLERSIAWSPSKDIIGRDVDQQGRALRAELGQGPRGADVE